MFFHGGIKRHRKKVYFGNGNLKNIKLNFSNKSKAIFYMFGIKNGCWNNARKFNFS